MREPHPFWPDLSARLPQLAAALQALPAPAAKAPAATPASPGEGTVRTGAKAPFVGPYELLHLLGEGGVASIWRARHVHPSYAGRPTVIKLLHHALRDDARLAGLFRREADVLSLVRHPNVVQTYDAGQHDGAMYLGMALVEGCDLAHLLWRCAQKRVAVPPALWIWVAHEVAAGLAYAHNLRDLNDQPLNLVHRDVNPANVLLSFAGEVKLSDFGVAFIRLQRKAAVQEVAGKAGYFPPEQLQGAEVDARGDVYALGATLYEMLAGKPLFAAPDLEGVMQLNRAGELPAGADFLPDQSPALREVLRTALAPRPGQRFADAANFQAALAPLCPPRAAAQLLLTSLVRQLFWDQAKAPAPPAAPPGAGGTGVQAPRDAGARPALASAPAPAQERREGMAPLPRAVDLVGLSAVAAPALAALLQKHGWSCASFADLSAWQQERRGLHPPAPVAVVDAAIGGAEPGMPSAAVAAAALRTLVRHLQLVVLADAFSLDAAQSAVALQARELWVPPFAVERALLSVAQAYHRATLAAGGDALTARQTGSTRQHVLAIVDEGQRQVRQWCRLEAEARGDALRIVSNFAEAFALLDEASFEVLLVHVQGSLGDVAAEIGRYRQTWGMGDVPCLYLHAEDVAKAAGAPAQGGGVQVGAALPPRCAWQRIGQPLQPGLERAYKSAAPGQVRAFARYPVALQAGLRLEGQVYQASTVNVSRRGLLLQTAVWPSVGTEVMLTLYLPDGQTLQVRGRALRVAMAPGADKAMQDAKAPAQLGIALTTFVRDGEQVWLRWLKQAAAHAAAAPVAQGWWRRIAYLWRK